MCLRMQVVYWYVQKLPVQDGLMGCRVCCCFVRLASAQQVPCHSQQWAGPGRPGLLPRTCWFDTVKAGVAACSLALAVEWPVVTLHTAAGLLGSVLCKPVAWGVMLG
jgi:hypothetical protein